MFARKVSFFCCSKSFTEYYDPATNAFKMGPKMPVNSVHGLCTALGPYSGLVYMAARREPGKIRAFKFNPEDETFEEIESINGHDARYFACTVVPHWTHEEFLLIGGAQ